MSEEEEQGSVVNYKLREGDLGRRADKVVARVLGSSRPFSWVQKQFRKKRVLVNDVALDASHCFSSMGTLKIVITEAGGEQARVYLPNKKLAPPVIYEDEALACVVKRSGLVMTPGPGHGSRTVVSGLLARFPELADIFGAEGEFGLVHRLDRGTSGALLVARSLKARETLQGDLAEGRIEKVYTALVHGGPKEGEGRIGFRLTRLKRGEKKVRVSRKGREAVTCWKVLESLGGVTLMELRPLTGRTHQIRVHCSAAGFPVCGDRQYGRADLDDGGYDRLMLHASSLVLKHPESGEALEFKARWTKDFLTVLRSVRQGFRGE